MSNDDIELAVDILIEAIKTPEGIDVFAESLVNTYFVDDEEMFKGEISVLLSELNELILDYTNNK